MTGSQIFGIILGIYCFSLLIEYFIFQNRYDKLYKQYINLENQATQLMYWTEDQLRHSDYWDSTGKSCARQELADQIIKQKKDFSLLIKWYNYFFSEKK